MPDVYISRAGMENRELDEKFTNTELGRVKEAKMKDETIAKLQRRVENMQSNLQTITRTVEANHSVEELEEALQRKLNTAAWRSAGSDSFHLTNDYRRFEF
jgi:polyhydroxyalkanoate synthesis regulator phasin